MSTQGGTSNPIPRRNPILTYTSTERISMRWFNRKPVREPKIHDYSGRNRTWGHDYSITKVYGKKVDLLGWGYGIKEGDFIILDNGMSTTNYQIKNIEYFTNPYDMWKATAVFSPREVITNV
jgi:MioC protein